MRIISLLLFSLVLLRTAPVVACSILFYVDPATGRVYLVNNEDYWYDVKPCIRIIPAAKGEYARLWYGWNRVAQGGVNAAGLCFDGASTPDQAGLTGFAKPRKTLGDEILAACGTVEEALQLIEQRNIALPDGHILLGDKTGQAAIVEWTHGQKHILPIQDNRLMMTNFLLTDTTAGNFPCPRYSLMEAETRRLMSLPESADLRTVGNVMAKVIQPKAADSTGREGGTLYSTFIDLTDMKFILIYKLDNSNMVKLDLKTAFAEGKKRTIRLE